MGITGPLDSTVCTMYYPSVNPPGATLNSYARLAQRVDFNCGKHVEAVTGLPSFFQLDSEESHQDYIDQGVAWLEAQGISVDICGCAVELTWGDELAVHQ